MGIDTETIRLAWAVPQLAKAITLLALVIAVTAGAILLVRRWAGRTGDDVADANELLSNFREVHARGGLSDGEYRTIKTKLAPELQAAPAASDAPASDATRPQPDTPTDKPIDPDPA